MRLVIPRAKRERLAERVAVLAPRRACTIAGCGLAGIAVVILETEMEAVLCSEHELVTVSGQAVPGQPMFVTAAW